MKAKFKHPSCGVDQLIGVVNRFDLYSCNGGILILRFGNERQEVFNLQNAMLREEGFFERNPELAWLKNYVIQPSVIPKRSGLYEYERGGFVTGKTYDYVISGTNTGRWATTAVTTTAGANTNQDFYFALDFINRQREEQRQQRIEPLPILEDWEWADTADANH